MAIHWVILIRWIVAHITLAQTRNSAGVARARVSLMADGNTSLYRH